MDRTERINEEMRNCLADILRSEIRDPRMPLIVSVTSVNVTRDLSHAKIYISVLGSEKEKADCFAALKSASSFIRRELTKRINLRISPELHFVPDETIERAMKMEKLISDAVKSDKEKRASNESKD